MMSNRPSRSAGVRLDVGSSKATTRPPRASVRAIYRNGRRDIDARPNRPEDPCRSSVNPPAVDDAGNRS